MVMADSSFLFFSLFYYSTFYPFLFALIFIFYIFVAKITCKVIKMYSCIRYFLLFFLFAFSLAETGYGQQATREQLLKLFYKANTARKANDQQTAIATYTEILKLSPGLPDPYLQLGDLYAAMSGDALALKKACVCYSTYLKLKPEAENAVLLKGKVEELQKQVAELEAVGEPGQLLAVVPDTVPEVKPTKPTFVVELSPQPEVKPDSALLAVADTAVADSLPVAPGRMMAKVDPRLLGLWVSAESADDGSEMWMLDIEHKEEAMWIHFNDHSHIQKEPLLADMKKWEAMAYADGDTLLFTFALEQKKEQEKKRKSLFGEFGAVVDELFDNWGKRAVKEQEENNIASADSLTMDSLAVDSLGDSLRIVREPMIIYTYEFRVAYNGRYLSGTLRHKIVERAWRETVLADEKRTVELFHAPDGYTGFCYSPISEEMKATKREFRELLNQKIQESAGNTSALNDLGCLYASGIGIRRNMKMAVAYFMEASMKNSLFGMLNMAQLYREGLGVEKDVEKARELYRRAYEMGYTDAMVLCGDTYLEGTADVEPDYSNALICYQKAAFKHCPYASYRLGWLYYEGLGVVQDQIKAWDYYQKAVAMQYADAMTDVGVFYRDGIMVPQDYGKALELLNKAAAKGNARAMRGLSQMYLRGQGVEMDFKQAKEWLYKSMQAGDTVIEGFNTVKSKINAILYPKI